MVCIFNGRYLICILFYDIHITWGVLLECMDLANLQIYLELKTMKFTFNYIDIFSVEELSISSLSLGKVQHSLRVTKQYFNHNRERSIIIYN